MTWSVVTRDAQPERGADAIDAKPGFCVCVHCPIMVTIPAGRFTMGQPRDFNRRNDETLPHVVIFERPFMVGKFEITVAQFARFVADTGYKADDGCWEVALRNSDSPSNSWRDPGIKQRADEPVICLSWPDAKAYASWLAQKTGKAYRLLSEAEWEYAARAGAATMLSLGTNSRCLMRVRQMARSSVRKGSVASRCR